MNMFDGTESIKVGFIDDEQDFLQVIKEEIEERFRSINLVALFSSEITDAFSWVENNVINTLVCDLRMPKLDGINLLKMIGTMNNNIELILLTGFVLNDSELDTCDAMGAHILYKTDGFENVVNNIILFFKDALNKEKTELPLDKMTPPKPKKIKIIPEKLENERKNNDIRKQIIDPIAKELIEELNLIKDTEKTIFLGDGQTITVGKLIKEIENLTPLGIEHIRLWINTLKTLKKLGKK